jgi:hypothetical protein
MAFRAGTMPPTCKCLTCHRTYHQDRKRPQSTREYCSLSCFERRVHNRLDNLVRYAQ